MRKYTAGSPSTSNGVLGAAHVGLNTLRPTPTPTTLTQEAMTMPFGSCICPGQTPLPSTAKPSSATRSVTRPQTEFRHPFRPFSRGCHTHLAELGLARARGRPAADVRVTRGVGRLRCAFCTPVPCGACQVQEASPRAIPRVLAKLAEKG